MQLHFFACRAQFVRGEGSQRVTGSGCCSVVWPQEQMLKPCSIFVTKVQICTEREHHQKHRSVVQAWKPTAGAVLKDAHRAQGKESVGCLAF